MLLRKRLFFVFLSITITVSGHSQNCDCESSFLWMKQTFEENDAGFQYIIDKKGEQAYNAHNKLFDGKVVSVKNNNDCAEILNEWLQFFRKGHIGITVLKNDLSGNTQETTQTFPDWEKIEMDTIAFKEYLNSKKDFDFEGIWQDETYTVGIKKTDNQFIGFIIDSQAEEWEKGQIKFRIYSDSAIYYMRNHSSKKTKVYLASRNFLMFEGLYSFWRIYPEHDGKFPNAFANREPYLEQLNPSTMYLQIPSFGVDKKELIDDILSENEDNILSHQNLIIDLRYNGGGWDGSWDALISFIYTNPIRSRSCSYLSSELNNLQVGKYMGEAFKEKLDNKPGEFVFLFPQKYYPMQRDSIYKNPRQIAILVNKFCASATEQFLLVARQSKKVKIFGSITAGALDFSNMNNAESPCGNFLLYFAMSKAVDIDSYPIDNIGIQPDYYLDKDIPEYKWIEYVNNILNYEMK